MADKERFLQNSKDGTIHGWNQWLALEPGMVEVLEEQAYPERFVKGGKRMPKVNMETEELADPPNDANVASGEQAGKAADTKTGKGFHP